MSEFATKIMKGQIPSDQDWNQYLIQAHKIAPSMTPIAFAPYKTSNDLTSYQILAHSIECLKGRDAKILDLACGDGYLFQFLLPILGPKGTIIGVDMSEAELDVARENFGKKPQIQLFNGTSQSIPVTSNTLDAIVCHMAFMLMLPLDPAIEEIHRCLKSGGIFSAVIGNSRGKLGFFSDVQKVMFKFLSQRYPKISEARSGDPRVQSESGIRELFSKGFDSNIEFFDFSLIIQIEPNIVWNLIKDMYFVSMLPDSEKKELEAELKDFTASYNQDSSFEFQMRMFTLKKL